MRQAQLLELFLVGWRHDSANDHSDAGQIAPAQFIEHLRHKRHVGAVEDADAEPIDVFILGGLGDGFDFLPQSAVDDMEAGVAEAAGDDFDAAVVAVEADFGEQHALRSLAFVHGNAHHEAEGRKRPNTSARASIHSCTVARQSAACSKAGITFSPAAAALRNAVER